MIRETFVIPYLRRNLSDMLHCLLKDVSVIPVVNLILDILTRFVRLQLKSLSKGGLRVRR